MQHARIYADDDGVSRFADVDVRLTATDFSPPAPPVEASGGVPAERVLMLRAPAGWFGDWHPAPRRQYVVVLAGEIEVTAGDGEARRFRAGDLLLVEDTTGRGHVTRVGEAEDLVAVFVQLPEPGAGAPSSRGATPSAR